MGEGIVEATRSTVDWMSPISRRELLVGMAALAGGAASCASPGPGAASDYDEAVAETWRTLDPAAAHGSEASLQREWVRQATLAASSHNTQCWRFQLGPRRIAILPDYSRRCPAVDPDDHHLFVSLGCATENLVLAAAASGFEADVEAESDGTVSVSFAPRAPARSLLFEAIPRRQSARVEYDGRPLSSQELDALETAAAQGHSSQVDVAILSGADRLEPILELIVEGNTAQIADEAFTRELKDWIRFGEAEALRKRDGLFTRTTGNPVVPRWIGSLFFDLAFRASGENDKIARQLRSSAGVAVFTGGGAEPAHWIDVGRSSQRFALQATALDVRTAFLNQPVEVARLRPELAGLLGLGARRPDLVVRFGRGPGMPRSLRRPVDAVLV
jgi:hypothetical protein